jgi:hypothetical protein
MSSEPAFIRLYSSSVSDASSTHKLSLGIQVGLDCRYAHLGLEASLQRLHQLAVLHGGHGANSESLSCVGLSEPLAVLIGVELMNSGLRLFLSELMDSCSRSLAAESVVLRVEHNRTALLCSLRIMLIKCSLLRPSVLITHMSFMLK